jgi:fumarate hydratase subunit alpha
LKVEESPTGKEIISMLLENARIAREEGIPICQDTGFAVVFIDLGQDVHLVGGDLNEAVADGVRRGYGDGYLRKSILGDPIKRVNTGDNTPPVIHLTMVPGEKVRIVVAPKGGGSENMSAVRMLKPADGIEGVKDFVMETAENAGGNPCPPIVVGVGIGGTFEKCAYLAKKALLRPLGERHSDPFYAEVEEELLKRINNSGVGPQGLGGRVTALDVHVETHPCHIASLPAAVNLNCHATRHGEITI